MVLYFWDTEPGPTTTDLGTSVVRLGSITGLTTQAEAGNSPTSSIEIDDPGGSFNPIGLWRFYVTETACPSGKQMLWNGYKRARRVRRGDAKRPSLRTGAARMWTLDLVDVNSLLDRDIIQGADDAAHGHRPAETDVARITWLIGSSFMNHIHDNGLFSTANPLNMDACDYRGQYGGDVLRDCSIQSGKNFFAYYDEASGQDSLFYDDPNSAAYDSGCTLSNVLADIDNVTTFGLLDEWELVRDPSKVYPGAYLPYSGGSTYRYSAAVAAAFYTRDGTAPNANISTLTAANAAADRFIADSATEDDRLTGRVKIPAAHVNDIYAGMLVSFKATHLPGYEAGRKCRVIIRSVAQDEESDEFYNVHLELSPIKMSACGPTATPTGFYGHLGAAHTTDAYGVVNYQHSGGSAPGPPNTNTPAPGQTDNSLWYTHYDASVGSPTAGTGTYDFGRDGDGGSFNLGFKGDGTATLHLAASNWGDGATDYVDIHVAWLVGVVWNYETVLSYHPITGSVTIDVVCGHALDGTDCIQWIVIDYFRDGGGSWNGNVGFGGVDWVQLLV